MGMRQGRYGLGNDPTGCEHDPGQFWVHDVAVCPARRATSADDFAGVDVEGLSGRKAVCGARSSRRIASSLALHALCTVRADAAPPVEGVLGSGCVVEGGDGRELGRKYRRRCRG